MISHDVADGTWGSCIVTVEDYVYYVEHMTGVRAVQQYVSMNTAWDNIACLLL